MQILRDVGNKPQLVGLTETYVRGLLERQDIGKSFEYLLNTGTLATRSDLGLSQTTGFTVVAEKLNFFRYISHFRSVHRGAYFMEIRTTAIRKLLPESFGFMCPVHTPDGAPCGLLNHLVSRCNIVAHSATPESVAMLKRLLCTLGVMPAGVMMPARLPDYLPVHVDGAMIGHLPAARAPAVVNQLREVKAAAFADSALSVGSFARPTVPFHMEVRVWPRSACMTCTE